MKKVLALIISCTMIIGCAACSSSADEAPADTSTETSTDTADPASDTEETTAATDDSVMIGIAHYSTADQGAVVYADQARAYCEEKGWEYTFLDANNDAEQQAKDFQDLINMGVDAILTVPVDAAACSDSVIAANEAGIPVAMMDRSTEEGDFLCLVQSDNEVHGYEAGVAMKDAAEAQGIDPSELVVVEIMGDMTASAGIERHAGFQRAAEEFGFNVVQEIDAEFNSDLGYNAVLDGLTAHPEANALFLASDNCYGSATISALEQLNMLYPTGDENHIIITAVDGGPDALEGIRDGYFDATASQQLLYMPATALDYVEQYLNGEISATEGIVEALEPQLVTIDNVDDTSLWANQ